MLTIPFFKPSIGAAEINEIVDILKSGFLSTGSRTKYFEHEFAHYVNQKHGIAVNSGTAALHLALEAIGLKAGQAVVVPTMAFAAIAGVVRHLGARPIFVDCRIDDYNLDIEDAERKIQSALIVGLSVVAIIPVHYGGQIADVAGVQMLARRYRLKIVADAAHCCPAHFRKTELDDWQNVGATADISCHSFSANQTITTGEGGIACTENDAYASRMRLMSRHGIPRRESNGCTGNGSWKQGIVAPGFNYSMSDLAAAMGIHQLHRADPLHQRRGELAVLYRESLAEVEEIMLPQTQPNRNHSWHLFVIRLKLDRLQIDRDQFVAELARSGIATFVHWLPLHMHPYYRATYGYAPEDLPVARRVYLGMITLPLYPEMTEEQVRYVGDSIKDIITRNRATVLFGHGQDQLLLTKKGA